MLNGTLLQAQEFLSLKGAAKILLEKNFDILVSYNQKKQAEVNNTAGNAGQLPTISASSTIEYGLNNTQLTFSDGRQTKNPNAGTINLMAGVALNYTFFDGGIMFLNKDKLNLAQRLSEEQLKATIQQSLYQLISTYTTALLQQKQLAALDTAMALAAARRDLSEMKFKNGTSAKVDYLQAAVDFNARQAEFLNQQIVLSNQMTQLNALLGFDPNTKHVLTDNVPIHLNLKKEQEQLWLLNSPQVQIFNTQKEIAEIDAKISSRQWMPKLSLNADYSYNLTRSDAGILAYNRSFGPGAALTLQMPLFDGGNINRIKKVQGLEARRQELLFSKQNLMTAAQYKNAWNNYENALTRYDLEKETVSLSRENKMIQQARFKVGLATAIETREAENSYVQSLQRLFKAEYDLQISEAEINMILGKLVE